MAYSANVLFKVKETIQKNKKNFAQTFKTSYCELKITKKIWSHHSYNIVRWRHILIDELPIS